MTGDVNPEPSKVLLDATSVIRSAQVLLEKKVTVSAVFALANLIEGVIFYDHLTTLSPFDPERDQLPHVVKELGLSFNYLSIPNERHGDLVRVQNGANNLHLGIARYPKENQRYIPHKFVDAAVAAIAQEDVRRADRESIARGESEPTGESALNSEAKWRFASYGFAVPFDDEDAVARDLQRIGYERTVNHGVARLAYRAELYMALSTIYRLPYVPDALRSLLVKRAAVSNHQAVASVARTILRNTERQVKQKSERLNSLLRPVSSVSCSLPIVLSFVLAQSGRSGDVVPEARALHNSRNAARLRRLLSGLQSKVGQGQHDADLRKEIAAIDEVTGDFVNEIGGSKTLVDWVLRARSTVIQPFISVLSPILAGLPIPIVAGVSTAGILAGLPYPEFDRYLLRRSCAILKDPLVSKNESLSLAKDVKRLFGQWLSAEDLRLLLSLRDIDGRSNSPPLDGGSND